MTTSIKEVKKESIIVNIYPNPVAPGSILHYNLPTPEIYDLNRIHLYSVYGQQIEQYPIHHPGPGTIHLPTLPAGVYFLGFEFEDGKIVKKIIVQ